MSTPKENEPAKAGQAKTASEQIGNSGASTEGTKRSVETLLKATLQLSNDAISGMFRNAVVKASLSVKDLEKMSFGTVNSSIRVGDVFKLVGLRGITQNVQGTDRELLLGVVENTKGEQRAIYMSSLFRTTPQANTGQNTYDRDVLDFDLGIMKNTNGMPTPKRIEKLIGDGDVFIHVTDEIQYTVKAVRQVDGTGPGQEKGQPFESTQRAFQLTHVSPEEARQIVAEGNS